MKSADGRDAEKILFGSVLSNDRHAAERFDYLIANPPYGRTGSGTRTPSTTSTSRRARPLRGGPASHQRRPASFFSRPCSGT